MSLPGWWLDPEWEELCESCKAIITKGRILCGECSADLEDMYSDEAVQDRLEGRRKP